MDIFEILFYPNTPPRS